MNNELLLSTKDCPETKKSKKNAILAILLFIIPMSIIFTVLEYYDLVEEYGDGIEMTRIVFRNFKLYSLATILFIFSIVIFFKKKSPYIEFYNTHIEGKNRRGNDFHLRYDEIENVQYKLAKTENDGTLVIIAHSVQHEIFFPSRFYNAAKRYFNEHNVNN